MSACPFDEIVIKWKSDKEDAPNEFFYINFNLKDVLSISDIEKLIARYRVINAYCCPLSHSNKTLRSRP